MLRRWTWLPLLAALLGGGAPARADLSIDVSPIRFELKGQAGGEFTDAVQVTNVAEEPVRLRSYLEDWDMTLDGTPHFLPVGKSPRSASRWIQASPSDFLLEPGQTEWVRFTIKVPAGVTDGAYYTALLLESMPLKEKRTPMRQVFVRGRVASMVYVTVGAPKRSALITSMAAVTANGRKVVRLEIKNDGDDVVRLAGRLECLAKEKPLGVPLELPDVPVLPGNKRRIDLEYPASEWKGGETARVAIDIAEVGRLVGDCSLNLTASKGTKKSGKSVGSATKSKTKSTKATKTSASKPRSGGSTKPKASKSGSSGKSSQ